MKLKKLKVVGFKSFADLVKFEFHSGITAIVGPNGCGKSNIADAFRWVLGEQSAKSLRGGRMQDIIFAGTSQRKPLNYAEVTLTMAGVEGSLPLGYDEVAVTRRLHRSGESEYSLNNQSVRLKDIQDLFLDSGIGKDAFAIFEQGKIDQIIQNSPLERRYIFEEAAGILRFLQRKREALRRLEQTDLNTSRLKDILLEVEKQIVVLEEQSERARIYKDNRSLLEGLEKAVILAKWDLVIKKRGDLSAKEAEQLRLIEAMAGELQERDSSLQGAREHLKRQEGFLKQKNEEVYKTRSDKAMKAQEKQSHQERLKEGILKEKRWQQELESLLEKRKIRVVESGEIQRLQKEAEKKLSGLEGVLKEQREKVAAAEGELSKVREQQLASQQKLMALLQKEGRLESELKQNTVRLDNDHDRKHRFLMRKEVLSKQIFETVRQLQDKRAQAQSSSLMIDEQKRSLEAMEKHNKELTESIQKGQESLNHILQEAQEAKARQKVLERMRADMEGFSVGSKKLLQESKASKSPLQGKIRGLSEYLAIEKGSEALLASALKPYAQTLVVDDEAALEEVLAYARKHKLKDYSLLCLAHLSKGLKKGKIDAEGLVPLIRCLEANKVSSHLVHDIMVAKERNDAFCWTQKQMTPAVTEEGFYIDGKSILFQTDHTESNVFMREAELKELHARLVEMESQRQEREDALRALTKTRTEVHQEQVNQDKSIRKAEMGLLELNFAIQRLQGDEAKAKQEISTIEQDLQALNGQIGQLLGALKEMQQKHTEAKAEAAEFQKCASGIQEQVQALSAASKKEQYALKEQEAVVHKLSDENKKLLHALHVFEVKELESIDQEGRINEEMVHMQELRASLQGKGSAVDKDLEKVEALLLAATQANAEVEKHVAESRRAIEKIEEEIAGHQKRSKQKEQELNQTRIAMAQLETAHASLEAELQDRHLLTIEAARLEVVPLERSVEQVEKQIKSLRLDLEEFGDVNLASIDECEKNKSRYESLSSQLDDLKIARQELIRVIAELDGESRKIFKDTFQKVRENFRKNFQILFSGGEADLQFTDTDDVLEAGIDIIARPPGKQMRSIQLLSGGEKCLTAMALLFAIFEVKPAPFCILDEIDAPLDDANVERFVQMVKHYNDRCQFIIITHNKRTMAIADVIFGVSMEERGISKLLSLEFATNSG